VHCPNSWLVALVAAPLLLLISGCGDQRSWFEGNRLWESEHFRYHSYADDDSVCEGVLGTLEAHWQRTHDYLGFAWKSGAKVDYYKFRTEEEFERLADCPDSLGCGGGLAVRAFLSAHQHELVHSYFDADQVYPPSFLAEGIAEVMSCEVPHESSLRTWRDVVEKTVAQDPSLGNDGAWLIGHLLKHYPRNKFLVWYDAVRAGDNADSVGKAFEAAYGVSLDTMWDEVHAFAGRKVQCVYLDECSAPALSLDGTPTTVGVSCDGSNQFRTIQVDEATNLVFQPNLTTVRVLSTCEVVPRVATYLSGAASLVNTMVRLEPGKYTFGADKESAPVEVKARAAPELGLTSSCNDSAAFAFDPSAFGATTISEVTVPPGAAGDTWFVRIAPGPGKYLVANSGYPEVALKRCLGCTGSCESIYSPGAWPLDAQGAATLRIDRIKTSLGLSSVSIDWRSRASP